MPTYLLLTSCCDGSDCGMNNCTLPMAILSSGCVYNVMIWGWVIVCGAGLSSAVKDKTWEEVASSVSTVSRVTRSMA